MGMHLSFISQLNNVILLFFNYLLGRFNGNDVWFGTEVLYGYMGTCPWIVHVSLREGITKPNHFGELSTCLQPSLFREGGCLEASWVLDQVHFWTPYGQVSGWPEMGLKWHLEHLGITLKGVGWRWFVYACSLWFLSNFQYHLSGYPSGQYQLLSLGTYVCWFSSFLQG